MIVPHIPNLLLLLHWEFQRYLDLVDWEGFEVHVDADSNTLEKGGMFSMCEEFLTNWRKERWYKAEARGEFYDEMDVSMRLDDLYKNADKGNIRAQTFVELGVETHPERAYRGFETWWDELLLLFWLFIGT